MLELTLLTSTVKSGCSFNVPKHVIIMLYLLMEKSQGGLRGGEELYLVQIVESNTAEMTTKSAKMCNLIGTFFTSD